MVRPGQRSDITVMFEDTLFSARRTAAIGEVTPYCTSVLKGILTDCCSEAMTLAVLMICLGRRPMREIRRGAVRVSVPARAEDQT